MFCLLFSEYSASKYEPLFDTLLERKRQRQKSAMARYTKKLILHPPIPNDSNDKQSDSDTSIEDVTFEVEERTPANPTPQLPPFTPWPPMPGYGYPPFMPMHQPAAFVQQPQMLPFMPYQHYGMTSVGSQPPPPPAAVKEHVKTDDIPVSKNRCKYLLLDCWPVYIGL